MSFFVIKKDGRKESYQIEKIKKVIQWATTDLDVNPLILESKFDSLVVDDSGITTRAIQENLIYHSRILSNPETPEWSIVAGRLETMLLWSDTNINEKTFLYFVREMEQLGLYKHKGIKKFQKAEVNELGAYLDQNRDLQHSYGSVLTAKEKYLTKGECIQQMFMVNAMIIASTETKEKRVSYAKEIYDALSLRKLSLATPWLSNLRANNNISSCFILSIDDSISSIFDNVKNAAIISKMGGGLGIDMARIRAKGSTINGVEHASKGVSSWTKIFNDTAVSVDQGGKRAGAFTVHVPIWHRDIEDFIDIQSENGDPRKKSFDIFPQVGIYDIFMREVIKDNGGIWYTFCPHEVKTVLGIELYNLFGKDFVNAYKRCVNAYKSKNNSLVNVGVYNAKELLKEIMKIQFESGLPYLSFLDTINEANPNSHDGLVTYTLNSHKLTHYYFDKVELQEGTIYAKDITEESVMKCGNKPENIKLVPFNIPCFNLCTESNSNVVPDWLYHTCNLLSIVVGRVDSDEEMINLSKLATRILDSGIELTKNPLIETDRHNNRYRTIGIGIQGLHDYLARYDIQWNDYKKIGKVAELIEYGAVSQSIELAKTKGAFEAFEGSKWATGEMVERFIKNSVTSLNWEELQIEIDKTGIRNSQMTSPAPNTSTSIFMDASAGAMPTYAGYYNEDNTTGKFAVFGMYIKEKPLAYERTLPRMSQPELTKMVSALQHFVDTGISAEYVFDQNNEGFNAKWLYDTIISAWKNNNKAIYYIRSIKEGESVDTLLNIETVCVGCSG